jgi:hypothetical protein
VFACVWKGVGCVGRKGMQGCVGCVCVAAICVFCHVRCLPACPPPPPPLSVPPSSPRSYHEDDVGNCTFEPNCTAHTCIPVVNYDGATMGWVAFLSGLLGFGGYVSAVALHSAQQARRTAAAILALKTEDSDDSVDKDVLSKSSPPGSGPRIAMSAMSAKSLSLGHRTAPSSAQSLGYRTATATTRGATSSIALGRYERPFPFDHDSEKRRRQAAAPASYRSPLLLDSTLGLSAHLHRSPAL